MNQDPIFSTHKNQMLFFLIKSGCKLNKVRNSLLPALTRRDVDAVHPVAGVGGPGAADEAAAVAVGRGHGPAVHGRRPLRAAVGQDDLGDFANLVLVLALAAVAAVVFQGVRGGGGGGRGGRPRLRDEVGVRRVVAAEPELQGPEEEGLPVQAAEVGGGDVAGGAAAAAAAAAAVAVAVDRAEVLGLPDEVGDGGGGGGVRVRQVEVSGEDRPFRVGYPPRVDPLPALLGPVSPAAAPAASAAGRGRGDAQAAADGVCGIQAGCADLHAGQHGADGHHLPGGKNNLDKKKEFNYLSRTIFFFKSV